MGYSIRLIRNGSKAKLREIKDSELPKSGQFALRDANAVLSEDNLELYVTYNYSWYFYNSIDKDKGIRVIYGLKAKDAIPILESAIPQMDKFLAEERKTKKVLSTTWGKGDPYDEADTNYWSVSAKNAKRAVENIIALGKLAPYFTFTGD